MSVSYNSTTDTYTMAFDDLDTWLSEAEENTVDTPYKITLNEYTVENCKGDYEPKSGTIQYILNKNNTKYVALKFENIEASINVTDASYMFYKCTSLTSVDVSALTNVTDAWFMFQLCTSLTSVDVSALTNVTKARSMFASCTSLTSIDVSALTNVTDAWLMFGSCTSLTSIDVSALTNVTDASEMFRNCTSLTSVDVSGMTNVTNASAMFRNCTSLTSVDVSGMTNVTNASRMFGSCTSLTSVDVSGMTNVTDASHMFGSCTSLTCISNNPPKSTNINYYTGNCVKLYNLGILDNSDEHLQSGEGAFNHGKALGYLGHNIPKNLVQSQLTGLKIYTTPEYFDSLTTSVAENYPNSNHKVILVDACLNYDELEDWLNSQPQNTIDTPYKIFIGGGLSADKLIGNWSNYICSDIGQVVLRAERFVDFSELVLPSDCTSLHSCLLQNNSGAPFVMKFCEIPNSVTDLSYFAYYNPYLENIGENGLIPSSVTDVTDSFRRTDYLKKLTFEMENPPFAKNMFSNTDYYWLEVYVKDYTYWLTKSNLQFSKLYTNRNIILECDYNDLDTYLSWFRQNVENVNLKITGLEEEDLVSNGSSSPYSSSDLCLKLLGTNISDSTVKGYVASSTFDLRLTEIPDTQTSLKGCFSQGNVSYCFAIPDSVTNMADTFYKCPLEEAPVLPSSLTNMSGTFVETNITTPPVIPGNVTNMHASFYGTEITTMPDIPNGVTTLARCFECSNTISSKHPLFTTTKQIPTSVTNMFSCFSGCDRLTTVENVPEYVTDLSYCFINCSSLVTVNNFAVDMSDSNVLKEDCFKNCISLTRINTVTQPAKKQQTWINYTIKTNSSDTNKYDITARYYTENSVQTVTKQINKYKLKSVITDEILFCANGTLSDSYIENMMKYQFPWGNKLDPSKKNFILWANEDGDVYTNLGSKGFVKTVNNLLPDNNGDVTLKTSDIANDSGYITSDANITGSSGSCTGNAATATKLKTARSITIKDYSNTYSGAAQKFDGSGNIVLKMPQVIQTYVQPIVTIISSSVSKSYAGRDTRYIVTTANITLTLQTGAASYEGCITEVFAMKACTVSVGTEAGYINIPMLADTSVRFIYYDSFYHYCGMYGAVWN